MQIKLRRALPAVLCCLLLFVCSAPSFFAAGEDGGRTVRVACNLNDALYLDADGNPAGYCADYLQALANIEHWHLQYISANRKESTKNLIGGSIDLLFPVQKSSANESTMAFSVLSGGYQPMVLAAVADAGILYNDFFALNGAKIAVSENSASEALLQGYAAEHGFTYEPVYIDSIDEKRQAVNSGAADYFVACTDFDMTGYVIASIVAYEPFYYAVQKENAALLQELNDGMQHIMAEQPELAASVYLNFLGNSGSLAHSEQEAAWISQNEKIVIGIYQNTPPLYHKQDGEEAHGIYVDVVRLLQEKTGADIEIYPIERTTYAYDLLQTGVIDFVMGSNLQSLKDAGGDHYHITPPVMEYTTVCVSRKGYTTNQGTQAVYALTNARKYWEASILEKNPLATFLYYKTDKDCMIAVQEGKADLTLMNAWSFNFQSKNARFKNLIEWENYRSISDVILAARIDADPVMLSLVDKGISAISDAEMDELLTVNLNCQYDDYTPADYWHIYQNGIFAGAAVLLGLFAAFSFYWRMHRKYVTRLEENCRQLDAASHAKSDFYARMSHDMRTPMNGILGIAELTKNENDPQKLHADLEKITQSGQYMLSLINDTLDLQRIEAGKLTLHPEICKASTLVSSALTMVETSAAGKGVKLRVENVNTDMENFIRADQVRVRQIVMNLLSNAIKFTPSGGEILFRIEVISRDEHYIHDKITISDTGIGMSKDFVEHQLFTPFAQEQNEFSMQYAGSGLGLSIVKSLLDLMGAKIEVVSELGNGTTFTIRIDFEQVPAEEAAKYFAAQKTQSMQSEIGLQGKRILLCEDHPLNAEITKRLLAKVGMTCEWAKDGEEGVAQFSSHPPGYYNAILMDIRMPHMNGIAAAEAIRAITQEDAKTIPIIAVSANAYQEDIEQSKQAGMNDHLSKPIEPQKLYEALQRCC